MEIEKTMSDEEKMRNYFESFINVYVTAANKAKLPADRERLEEIVRNAEFKTFEIPNMTGTFSVNKKLIQVILNNFRKNGSNRNLFLILHEFAHLDSGINEELFKDQSALLQQLNEIAKKSHNENLNEINAYYGILAIDEVVAQWTCEELNDALNGKKREICKVTGGPLNSKISYTTDFSDNDIYSPLEQVVEKMIQSVGYKDIRTFTTDVLASNTGIMSKINSSNFEKLCNIGIICKGIYKENGFEPSLKVTANDIENAFESLMKNSDLGENNGGSER